MNTTDNLNLNSSEQSDESVNIRELLNKYAFHWPVFFVGLLICMLGAFFYLRYAEPVYVVNSILLIKDDKKGGMPKGADLLNELDFFGSSKVVDNEIEILKSKTLMSKVIDRLNLTVDYRVEGRVINSDVYATKPIDIGVVQMDSTWYGKSLILSFPSRNQYLLEDPETGVKVKGLFNTLQRNKFGIYKITPNEHFSNWKEKQLTITIYDPQVVLNNSLTALNVGLASKQSTVLNLGFETIVPQRGKDILNTLIQVYNEAALADKNRTTQSTIQFIDERLKLISGELTDVERDVESFKSSRGLTDLTSDAQLYLENVKVNDAKINEVELQLSVIKDVQRYVNSDSPQEKLPSTLGINDPVLLGQITQLGELQLKRDQLLATTQSGNPLLEPIVKQIETTRAGILANVQNITKSLTNTKKELQGNSNQYQGSIKQLPGQERQFISIKRQQTIKESLYLYLLQKKEEAALSYASAVADSRIVDPAFAANNPIKPKKQLVYLMALALGLFLPVVYIYGRELFNNKVEGSSDLAKLTATPILGEILYNESSEAIVVNANSRKAIAEQFRAIRTNMQFLHGKKTAGKGTVTLLTSSMSGEGKSFVSTNIAAALAISGKKTVLLELDLRKPKVSKYMDLTNKVGLSNYLIGKAHINDIIQPSNINENFFVIGSGPIPPNPSELLIGDEIEELFSYLRSNFDEIVVDTPPIGLVTDAQLLARLVDASIYIVRHKVTFKQQILKLNEIYKSDKFPKINIILNGVQVGGSYGYGYGYGYGYYSDDVQHDKVTIKTILKNLLKRF